MDEAAQPSRGHGLTPAQCRAARALIAASQDDLAVASGIAKRTFASFEAGTGQPCPRTLARLRSTLEGAGVILLEATDNEGSGVRQRRPPAPAA